MFNVFDLQKQLVAAASPSGSEYKEIAPLLAKLAKPFVDEVKTDALGNVICYKKGKKGGKKIMLAAHMDAIGFMVTSVDEKGYVWFTTLGGFSPVGLINARVRFSNGTRGIIKIRKNAKQMEKPMQGLRRSDLFIDIGAGSKKEAEKAVKLGDVAVYEGEPRKVAGGNIIGPYADDLVACTVFLLAMEQLKDCENDTYWVFTSQEEVGCRGAVTAAYGIEPDIGFACDVTGTGDTPGDDEVVMECGLGKGPAIKIKDSSVICNPQLNEKLRKIAKAEGIPVQDEILTGGGTDTCAIQMTRAGVPATCISIPTRYIHSPVEMFNEGDAENAAKLLLAAVRAKY